MNFKLKKSINQRRACRMGRVRKEMIIPKPTNAAVKGGARPAMMASAPAEIIGGIPDSRIET